MVLLFSLVMSIVSTDSSALPVKDTVHTINKLQVFTGMDKFNFETKSFSFGGRNRLLLQPRLAPVAGFYVQYKRLLFAVSKSLLFTKSARDNPAKATNIGATYLGERWALLGSLRHYKGLELLQGNITPRVIYPSLTYLQVAMDGYKVVNRNGFSVKSAFGYTKKPSHTQGAFLYFLHFDGQQWNQVPIKRQNSIYVPAAPGNYRYVNNLVPAGGYAYHLLLGKGFNGAALLHAGLGASLVAGRATTPAWGWAWDVGSIFQIGYNGKNWYSYILAKDDYLNHTQSKAQLLNNSLQSAFLVLGRRF